MPLPGLELETSGFDIMLGFMHQPDEPKSLSFLKEVDNPLILHNNITYQSLPFGINNLLPVVYLQCCLSDLP